MNGPDQDYKALALRTEFTPDVSLDRVKSRLLHAGLGLATESGEFLDALKKNIIYGKPLDLVNIVEEVGDVLWYCAIALDACGVDFPEAMHRNIDKLRVRFPKKFTQDGALHRDLDAERASLEQIIVAGAARFDEKPLSRASIAARAELAQTECVLSEGTCKAADCPRHGWIK